MKTSYQILEDYLENNQKDKYKETQADEFIFNSKWLDRMVWKNLNIENKDYGILTFFFIPAATKSRKNPLGFGPITIWTYESMFINFQQASSPGKMYLDVVANGGIPRTNIYKMLQDINSIRGKQKRRIMAAKRREKIEEELKFWDAIENQLKENLGIQEIIESPASNGYFYSKFYFQQLLGVLGIDIQGSIFHNVMKNIGFLGWNPSSFQKLKYNVKQGMDAVNFNFKPVKKRLVNSKNPFIKNRTQYLLKEEGKRALKGYARKDVALLNDSDLVGELINANKKDYMEVSEVKKMSPSGAKRNKYKVKNRTVRGVQPGQKFAPKAITPVGRGIRFVRIILAVSRDYKKK